MTDEQKGQEPTVEQDTQEITQEPVVDKKSSGGSSFYKQKIEELERINQERMAEIEAMKTTQLKEKENYKELWEIEKKKRLTAEEKATKIASDYLSGLKMSAIEQEAMKAGIIPEALKDIRIDDAKMVEIETGDRGSVNILGAKEYVEYLKETRPFWFQMRGAPRVNSTNPSQPEAPKELTPAELIALEKTNPAKYREEMQKRLKLV